MLLLALPLAGCGLPAAWAPALAAGFGFGAAVASLDGEILAVWDRRNPPENLKPEDSRP